jgi:SNF2 family DNA or RNA helicase
MTVLDELDSSNALVPSNHTGKFLGLADAAKLGQVDAGLLATLQRINPPEQVPDENEPADKAGAVTRDRRRIAILVTKSNFDAEEYKKGFNLRHLQDASTPPMRVEPKAHQREGVLWLVSCYLAGWPGVLLADDMGLGKTLQSLIFLALLRREGVIKKGSPALIVAPTSLLRNWQDEHAKHMLGEGLGTPLVAFGSELRNLKQGHASSDGFQILDSAQIAANTWVLTTYETVRDYHFSFAQVPFSVAVLDEIQKAKNPATRLNATLKTLPIEFVLSMTGTPVENSISDLWAITDITAPGYFPPLREFMKKYERLVRHGNGKRRWRNCPRKFYKTRELVVKWFRHMHSDA